MNTLVAVHRETEEAVISKLCAHSGVSYRVYTHLKVNRHINDHLDITPALCDAYIHSQVQNDHSWDISLLLETPSGHNCKNIISTKITANLTQLL